MGYEFLGTKLLGDRGNKTVDLSVLDSVPVVALYFSAHWCPPCKMFTPVLAKTYQEINSGIKQLEIIFISSDQSEEDFKNYYGQMPFLAMQFDQDKLSDIADKFDIGAIPCLTVLNKDGTVKIANAKLQVEQQKSAVIEEWRS